MRNVLTGLVVAATTILVPMSALADNQEIANQIAANLKGSGQLSGYKVAVKFQDGTAWLKGQVRNRGQMSLALKTAFQTKGVSRVVNQLAIGSPEPAKSPAKPMVLNQPKRGATVKFSTTRQRQAKPSGSLHAFAKPKSVTQFKPPTQLASRRTTPREQPAAKKPRPKPTQVAAKKSRPVPVAQTAVPAVAAEPVAQAAVAQSAPPLRRIPMPNAKVLLAPLAPLAVARTMAFRRPGRPVPIAYLQNGARVPVQQAAGRPVPMYTAAMGGGVAPARYDSPHMPNYSWPSYASYPNYAGLTYPKQYSPTAWPYIGPFYPYPQVPLGWRKVTLEWDDGWWMLDFKDKPKCWP